MTETKIENLFLNIFDLHNGYILKDNILFLKENNLTEKFNKNKLLYLIENQNEIEQICRKDARNLIDLEKFYKHSSNGKLNVHYSQKDNGLYGRYFVKHAIGGANLMREYRHVIYADFYNDVDLINAHPTIISWLCKNMDIDCKYLNMYINNRIEIINDLIELNPHLSFSWFKMSFISIMYGCEDKTFDNNFPYKNDFIIKFRNEFNNIAKSICDKLYKFKELNNKSYNLYGSTLCHIATFVENQLLMLIIEYFKDKQFDLSDAILCFDGIMINKRNNLNIVTLLGLDYYFRDMGININCCLKEMDCADKLLKLCDYDHSIKYIYEDEKKIKLTKEMREELNNNKVYNVKQFIFEDKFYYMDFINLIFGNKNKIFTFDEIEKLFIENINRVLFIVINQKNAFYAKLNNSTFVPIEPTQNKVCVEIREGVFQNYTFKCLCNTFYNDIKMYNSIGFYPFTKYSPLICNDNRNFNLFNGYQADLLDEKDINMNLINPLLYHIKEVLANNDYNNYIYLLSWFNKAFRTPQNKTKVALVFKSTAQQAGKGIILNQLIGEYIFGNGLYKMNNGLSFLNERFNDDEAGVLLNISEELSNLDSNNSYNQTFDRLKSKICDDKIKIEPKFGKKYDVNHHTNYIFNTNSSFPIKIESHDARFAVFEISEKFVGNYEYFTNLSKYINQECANHLYSYIYYFKDLVELRTLPKNDFYNNVKFNSVHNSIRFLFDIKDVLFNFENMYYEYESWESLLINNIDDNYIIGSSKLNECYKKWCAFTNERNTSPSKFKIYTERYIDFNRTTFSFYNLIKLKNLTL